MNRTRATLVWSSAPTKLADATATHTATATPASPTALNAWTHPAALDDGDVGEQRGAREHRPAAPLRRGVERELALQATGGGPRNRGERHIDLPAALAPRSFERHGRGVSSRPQVISDPR